MCVNCVHIYVYVSTCPLNLTHRARRRSRRGSLRSDASLTGHEDVHEEADLALMPYSPDMKTFTKRHSSL